MPSTIMVVDDEEAMRHLLRIVLSRAGYRVIEAIDGRDALEKLVLVQPDLMIIDVLMPFLNGFEVVQQIRAHPHTAQLPVMLLSSRADAAAQREGLFVGAQRYLIKPLTLQQLLTCIQEVLDDSQD
jgi:DNA-binding response OmpR family regulator